MNKNRLNIRKRDEEKTALVKVRREHVFRVKDLINPIRNIRKIKIKNSAKLSEEMLTGALLQYDTTELILTSDNTVDATIKEYQKASRESAEHYKETKEMWLPNILVLDFASFKRAGGGFMSGSRAQEESLCERTDLYAYLENHRANSWYNENRAFCRKNLRKPGASLYNDNQLLISDVLFYENNEPIAKASVLVTAAPNYKAYVDNSSINYPINAQEYVDSLESRIRSIFVTAYDQGFNTLVLGAFGCGVFGNNPSDVSLYFYKYIQKYMFLFKRIIFAIPEAKTEKVSNYWMFNRCFLYNFNCFEANTKETVKIVSSDTEPRVETYVFTKADNAEVKDEFVNKVTSIERIVHKVEDAGRKSRGLKESIIFRGR